MRKFCRAEGPEDRSSHHTKAPGQRGARPLKGKPFGKSGTLCVGGAVGLTASVRLSLTRVSPGVPVTSVTCPARGQTGVPTGGLGGSRPEGSPRSQDEGRWEQPSPWRGPYARCQKTVLSHVITARYSTVFGYYFISCDMVTDFVINMSLF